MIIVIIGMEMMNDRKYTLIKPFWEEVIYADVELCRFAWPFGPVFSYQFKSISMVAMCWPICRFARGDIRWNKWVKYPSMFEKW